METLKDNDVLKTDLAANQAASSTGKEFFDELDRKHQEEIATKEKHLNKENLLKVLNIKGIERLDSLVMDDCEIDASDLIRWVVSKVDKLEKENERLTDALVCIYDGGYIQSKEAENKVRLALGLELLNADSKS